MKTSGDEILNELIFSQKRGNAIGIKTKDFKKLFITAVEQVVTLPENDKVVILKPVGIHGETTPKTEIRLQEIEGVVRFRMLYTDPFYTHLRDIKTSIQRIKTSIQKMNLTYYHR